MEDNGSGEINAEAIAEEPAGRAAHRVSGNTRLTRSLGAVLFWLVIFQFFSALARASGPNQVGANCAWYVRGGAKHCFLTTGCRISRDVINYVRTDGTVLGAALLAAIDTVRCYRI